MKFYVYELIDPRNNEVFYVGKGTGNRAYVHQYIVEKYGKDVTNNSDKFNLIGDILSDGLDVIVKKVFKSNDEALCYEMEDKLIQEHGLYNLTNICSSKNAGKLSEAVKEGLKKSKLNKKRLEYIKSDEYRNMCRENNLGEKNPFYGKGWNSLQREVIIEANKKPKSESHKKNISKSLKNSEKLKELRASKEWRDKLSNSLKSSEKFQKAVKSDEYRKKQSELSKGANNPRAKTFKFTSPDGEEFKVTGGFNKFIKERGLSRYHMLNVKNGKKNDYKGWKVE